MTEINTCPIVFCKYYLKNFFLIKTMSKQRNDLFDNPMVREARKNMTQEQIDSLEKKGEDIFATDIVSLGTENDDTSSKEVLEQITIMLKSGIHPSYLSREEKDFLKSYVGEKWYEDFGYLENDLNRINL